MWYDADQALLLRLEDAELCDALYSHQHAGVPSSPLPEQASGLITCLRDVDAASGSLDAARCGQPAELAQFVTTYPLTELPPPLVHHLAVYFARLASGLASHSLSRSLRAWQRALAAWTFLVEQRSYLHAFAVDVLGKDSSRDWAQRSLSGLHVAFVEEAAKRARSTGRSEEARVALACLANIRQAYGDPLSASADQAVRRARRRHMETIDLLLAPYQEQIQEHTASGKDAVEVRPTFQRIEEAWFWAQCNETIEHVALEKVEPFCWELYRARRWDDLRKLLVPVWRLVDSLSTRVEQDPRNLAYAASCAEMLTFYSQLASGQPEIELAERAWRICPSHRNARLVLASVLCNNAITIVSQGLFAGGKLQEARALVDRARQLWPESRRLDEATKAVEQAEMYLRPQR